MKSKEVALSTNRRQLPSILILGGMASDKSHVYVNIKRLFFREIKTPDQSLGMDIFRTEEEVLLVFYDMCHVIIRTVPPVPEIYIFCPIRDRMPVNNLAKGAEFIFLVDRLKNGIRSEERRVGKECRL